MPGAATRVFLAPGATDLRRACDGLHGLVRCQLAEAPRSGPLFRFCHKSRNRLKVFCFDGPGAWVCAKRLERSRLTWPPAAVGRKGWLRAAELAILLGGLELTRAARQNWWRSE